MDYVIEIENLSKEYEVGFWKKKRVRALDDVSLKVRGGQVFGFLGGNGAGKTTTIKILMTLLYPTGGNARILGSDISQFAMHHRIGYSPENPYFYDYLTPRELLGYFADLFALEKATAKKRVVDLLSGVGLDEKDWDKQMRKFSKGMMQRVSIAQSLINDPEVVFMDEPMSGLDPMGRREVRELIADLRLQGKTIFMSTHILSDVEALCDEVAILRKGKLAATGRLDDLLESHAGEQTFEVNLRGINADDLRSKLGGGFEIGTTPGGVRVKVDDERSIDTVLGAARTTGGSLISVNPVKQSLEELFVSKTGD
jgi:ABC-2 type transport system ATP-binding protein